MADRNRQWLLAAHPQGLPKPADWRLVERALARPEMLVRALYLSVGP